MSCDLEAPFLVVSFPVFLLIGNLLLPFQVPFTVSHAASMQLLSDRPPSFVS
jgi:hypothetical protein